MTNPTFARLLSTQPFAALDLDPDRGLPGPRIRQPRTPGLAAWFAHRMAAGPGPAH